MKTKFFYSTLPGNKIGDGTIKDLVAWLEKFINILFPDNGIDYWSSNRFGDENDLKCQDAVPACGIRDDDLYQVACSVQVGHSEGERIKVLLQFRNGMYKQLTSAKSFGSSEENWMIARVVTAVLDSILLVGNIPELVEMAGKVPRQKWSSREANVNEIFTISTTLNSIKVGTGNGLVLDERSWSWLVDAENAKSLVESRLKDWQIVLTNLKANFSVSQNLSVETEDLHGYIISNRGLPDIRGLYVLPPGGNPLNDRHYLGYFATTELALEAARTHRDFLA